MRALAVSPVFLALTACATGGLAPANEDFSPPPVEEIVSGFGLRDRYDLPKYVGSTAIYVDSVAVHHLRSEASTIVWKDRAGQWQRDQAVETGPGGLLRAERKLESHEIAPLTDAEARALERLIRDPGLYSGEVRQTGEIGVGAFSHVMAIVTPFGRKTVKWDGRLRGTMGSVADIVLGHE